MENAMKLLSESVNSQVEILTEGEGKDLYIEGIFAEGDLPNGNNRVYPKKILFSAFETYNERHIQNRNAYGELDHPPTPAVSMKNACMLMTEIKFEGANVLGKAKVFTEGNGRLLRSIIDAGAKPGVSTRGVAGMTMKEGVSYIKDNYRLFAVDVVGTPSAPNAFVNGVMESIDWMYEDGIIRPAEVDKVVEVVQEISFGKSIRLLQAIIGRTL